jgi:uncharacterized protein YrrD
VDEGSRPIAWLALRQGTVVRARGGQEVGKVGRVVGDQQKDIFSGITVVSGLFRAERFAPAELVAGITESEVRLSLSPDQADQLEVYDQG